MSGRLVHYLNYLRVFCEVASCKSFTRAAEKLHISQPAVTRQVRNLERILGMPLFDRSSTPVKLTSAGKTLFSYAEKAFTLIEDVEKVLAHYRKEQILRIGIGTTTGYSIPEIVSRFQAENPKVKIVLHMDSSLKLQEEVLKENLDLAIAASPDIRERGLAFIPFRREPLVCITPVHLSLDADQGVLPLEKVTEFPFILREQGSATHKVVINAFKKLGQKPKMLVEASSSDFIKEWVKAGKGLSIVPANFVEEERCEGKFKVFSLDPPLWLDVFIVLLRGRSQDPLIHCFLRYLLNSHQLDLEDKILSG